MSSGALTARRAASGAPYPYRKLKETQALIFLWLSWLAVLLVGAYARRRRRRWSREDGGHPPNNRLTETCSLGLYDIMLWSIDTCQIKLSADQYLVTGESFFAIFFLAPGLITCLSRVWNYCYVYRSDLTPFKCWSGFRFFLGLIASFLQVRLTLTCGRQW